MVYYTADFTLVLPICTKSSLLSASYFSIGHKSLMRNTRTLIRVIFLELFKNIFSAIIVTCFFVNMVTWLHKFEAEF